VLQKHIFLAEVLPDSSFYLGILGGESHVALSERLLLGETKVSTYFLCGKENVCLPLARNWILRVAPDQQMQLITSTYDIGLTSAEKLAVIDTYLTEPHESPKWDILKQFAR
jgi:hypothetical protein